MSLPSQKDQGGQSSSQHPRGSRFRGSKLHRGYRLRSFAKTQGDGVILRWMCVARDDIQAALAKEEQDRKDWIQ